ncbi:hypothetical protein [Thermococcus celericrescens]|uniref:hypothetical protein n=1 Tax=Thermococcus celericrescens TaxID=227598 RepID=UPI000AE30771|nr:hypothetical protein [Thermococcus celericrescens]
MPLDSTIIYTVPVVLSRLRLLSITLFKDHYGTIHSGEAGFLVEPLETTINVFIPVGEHAEKLSKLEGRYVEIEINPPFFETSGPVNAEKPSIALEPPVPGVPAPHYRLVGVFKIFTPLWGVFECGNLRFPLTGDVNVENGKSVFHRGELRIDVPSWDEWPEKLEVVKSAWIEVRGVRFYGYLPEGSKRGETIWSP